MRVYLSNIWIEDAPYAHAAELLALSKKQTAKRRKEELSEQLLMHYIIMRWFILRSFGTLLLRLIGSRKNEYKVIEDTRFEEEYSNEGDTFGLRGPENAVIQEWQDLHYRRANITYQNDSIKEAVTPHPNQATSVAICMKGAATARHKNTRHLNHLWSLSWKQWWIWALGKA